MARLKGFEPSTYGLEVRRSIQLSYKRPSQNKNNTLIRLVLQVMKTGKTPRNTREKLLLKSETDGDFIDLATLYKQYFKQYFIQKKLFRIKLIILKYYIFFPLYSL